MKFFQEKKCQQSMGLYRQVLYGLVQQEIRAQFKPKAPCNWNGDFKLADKSSLDKLETQLSLSRFEVFIIKWEVYAQIQVKTPDKLHPGMMCNLFDQITKLFDASKNCQIKELYPKFWSSVEYLTSAASDFLVSNSKVILEAACNQNATHNYLKFFDHICKYLNHFDLHYGTRKSSIAQNDLQVIKKSFFVGTMDWFNNEVSQISPTGNLDNHLELVLKFVTMLCNSLKLRKIYWSRILEGIGIGLDLFRIVFFVWDEQLAFILKPILDASSLNTSMTSGAIDQVDFSLAQENLYRLYLVTVEFCRMGHHLIQLSKSPTVSNSYHTWFLSSVLHWIYVLRFKNMERIEKAVELDNLKPVDEISTLSSSAVDVSEILTKMNDFWIELAWPIPEESYCFLILLVKNLFRYVFAYVEVVSLKVKELKPIVVEKYFFVSEKGCTALNNIEAVRVVAGTVLNGFKIQEVLQTLATRNGIPIELREFGRALPRLVDDMNNRLERKVQFAIKLMLQMRVKCFLISHLRNFSALNQPKISIGMAQERLIYQFQVALSTLRTKVPANTYSSLANAIWNIILKLFGKELSTCGARKESTISYQRLQLALFHLEKLFSQNVSARSRVYLLRLRHFMRLFGSSTSELIIEYLMIRFCEQCKTFTGLGKGKRNSGDNIGLIVVCAEYYGKFQKLHLEILHAILYQDLQHSYVKIQVLTRNDATDPPYFYTQVKPTKYPLFETKFCIDIDRKNWSSGGIIRLWLKTRGPMKMKGKIIGQAFLPLETIPINIRTETSTRVQSPTRLVLSNSAVSQSKLEILSVLTTRNKDKLAANFVRREKSSFKTYFGLLSYSKLYNTKNDLLCFKL